MERFLIAFVCTLLYTTVASQNLETYQCQKAYRNFSTGGYYTNESPELYQYEELFQGACSWQCNYLINMSFYINQQQDSTLVDGSITNCLISNEREINAAIFLKEDSLDRMDENTEKVGVTGFLISNGNRESRDKYLKYSRVKSARISINGSIVGTAFLEDTPKVQYVSFGKLLLLNQKLKIQIQIVELYEGKVPEYSISELWFDGTGGHSLTPRMCSDN